MTLRTCWDPHLGGWYELVGKLEFDAAVQGAIERTMHRVAAVDILDRVARVLGRYQAMMYKDAVNDEDAFLRFHLPTHVAGECPSTCLNLPRCQRGGKRAL